MKISETFHSIQGEGHLTGKPMFFIRAQGCSVKCPIREVCDQPESLAFRGGAEIAPATLADMALAAVGSRGWVSITGGEPLDQPDFDELVAAVGGRVTGCVVLNFDAGAAQLGPAIGGLENLPAAAAKLRVLESRRQNHRRRGRVGGEEAGGQNGGREKTSTHRVLQKKK